MSRAIRRKAPAPSHRKSRRDSTSSSSSLDLSSDGGYSVLDEASESDDDDEDGVDATEEKYIIKDVVKSRHGRVSPRSKSQSQSEDEDADKEDEGGKDEDEDEDENDDEEEDDDDDDDDDDNDGEESDENEDDGNGNGEDADDNASWNGIATESEANNAHTSLPKRQVRFTGVPDSDSDSTTTELSDIAAEFFPDIFVEQNSLDPAFRREIEDESDSTVSSSFWDYSSAYGHGGHGGGSASNIPFSDDEPATPSAANSYNFAFATSVPSTPLPPVAEEEEEESQEDMTGYETDGDTTEEEELEELPVRRKAPRRLHSADGDSSSSESVSDVSVRHRRGQPRVGRFILDAKNSKPVAVMHPVTGKMVIFTPEKPRPYNAVAEPFTGALDLLPPPPHEDLVQSSPSPLITNSASVMMGAMFSSHTFGDYVHSQNVGPVEAFFPGISSDAFMADESDYSGDLLEDDGEFNLRLEDFIQFERSLSDVGAGDKTDLFDEKTVLPSETDENGNGAVSGTNDEGDDGTTPVATPSRRESFTVGISSDNEDGDEDNNEDDIAMPPLLAHFDKNADAVGAFRRNQVDQQLIYSNKATAESLAFSGPYIMGTLRGIKNGSLEAVATPITPPRRRKRHSISLRHDEYIRSPLGAAVQKRKASGPPAEGSAADHKRQRSISEVKDLML